MQSKILQYLDSKQLTATELPPKNKQLLIQINPHLIFSILNTLKGYSMNMH